jgi:hypothetical protein
MIAEDLILLGSVLDGRQRHCHVCSRDGPLRQKPGTTYWRHADTIASSHRAALIIDPKSHAAFEADEHDMCTPM